VKFFQRKLFAFTYVADGDGRSKEKDIVGIHRRPDRGFLVFFLDLEELQTPMRVASDEF
jgi:hypothetical protein